MKDKFPEIFKNKVDKIKSKVQKEFYYHNSVESNTDKREVKIDKMTLLKKIESIFSRPDYVYKADITILYKKGENINKKIVGIKDNYLLTIEGEKIYVDDIYDIK